MTCPKSCFPREPMFLLRAASPQPQLLHSVNVATRRTSSLCWWQNLKTKPKSPARWGALPHMVHPTLTLSLNFLSVYTLVLAYQLFQKVKFPSSRQEGWSPVWSLSNTHEHHLLFQQSVSGPFFSTHSPFLSLTLSSHVVEEKVGQWDSLVGKDACHSAWGAAFDPWDPHSGRKKLTLKSFPVTSHTHTP